MGRMDRTDAARIELQSTPVLPMKFLMAIWIVYFFWSDKGKENAEASYKAKPRAQCLQSDAGSEDIYPWLDRLFSSSRYEADADVLG